MRSYTFSPSNIVTLGTSQTEWLLQVSSKDGYTAGQTIPVTVSVSLEFSSITANYTFNVTITNPPALVITDEMIQQFKERIDDEGWQWL